MESKEFITRRSIQTTLTIGATNVMDVPEYWRLSDWKIGRSETLPCLSRGRGTFDSRRSMQGPGEPWVHPD